MAEVIASFWFLWLVIGIAALVANKGKGPYKGGGDE